LLISTSFSRLLLSPYDPWKVKVATWKESMLNQVSCEDGKKTFEFHKQWRISSVTE
jgi:hypothetical protein